MATLNENVTGVEGLLEINESRNEEKKRVLAEREQAQIKFDSYGAGHEQVAYDPEVANNYKATVEPWRFEQSMKKIQDESFDRNAFGARILDEHVGTNPNAYQNLTNKQNREQNIYWAGRKENWHLPTFNGENKGDFKLTDDQHEMMAVAGWIAETGNMPIKQAVDNLDIYSAAYATKNGLSDLTYKGAFSHIKAQLNEEKDLSDNDRKNWKAGRLSALTGMSENEAFKQATPDKRGNTQAQAIMAASRSHFLNEYGNKIPESKKIFDLFKATASKTKSIGDAYEEHWFAPINAVNTVKALVEGIGNPEEIEASYEQLALMSSDDRKDYMGLIFMMAEQEAGELDAGFFGKFTESFVRGFDTYIENIEDFTGVTGDAAAILLRSESVKSLLRKTGLTEDEAVTRARREVRQDLRNIKEIVAEVKSDNKFVQGMYDASRSATYTLSASMGYGVGVGLNAMSMTVDNDVRLRELYPDMNPSARWRVSLSAGVIQSGVERLQWRFFAGQFPLATKWIAGKGIARQVGTGLIRIGATVVTENAEESIQAITLPLMQELWRKLGKDVPSVTDADWEESAFIYDERTFFATLPLALLGAGTKAIYENYGAKKNEELLSDVDMMRLHGLDPDVADAIAAEPDVLKKFMMFNDGVEFTNKEAREANVKAAIDDGSLERIEEIQESKAFEERKQQVMENGTAEEKRVIEAQEIYIDNAKKFSARIKDVGNGSFKLVYPEANVRPTEIFESKEEADAALDAFHREGQEALLSMISAADVNKLEMDKQKATLEKKHEGAEVNLEQNLLNLYDWAKGNDAKMKVAMDRVRHAIDPNGTMEITEADVKDFQIKGEVRLKNLTRGYVARVAKGGNIAELVEEGSEGFMRDLIRSGFIQENWVKEQIIKYQKDTGTNISGAETVEEMTYDQMVESFSDLAVANFWNVYQDNNTGKLGGLINALRVFFANVARIALDLAEVKKEGKMDADFETLLDQSVGIGEEEQFERRVGEANKEIVEQYTFAVERKESENAIPVHYSGKKDKKGKLIATQIPYRITQSPLAEDYASKEAPESVEAEKLNYEELHYEVTPTAQKRINGVIESGAADEAANQLVDLAKEMLKDPDVAAGQGWYGRMRKKLKDVFGEDMRLFTHMLGTTSAQTAVEQNFQYSVEASNMFKEGLYDKKIEAYTDLRNFSDSGKEALIEETLKRKILTDKQIAGKKNSKGKMIPMTDKGIAAAWIEHYDMQPRRRNKGLYGANSTQLLKALSHRWIANKMTPKTPQFAMNLNGDNLEATIDIWAARTLRKIMWSSHEEQWRIQPKSEGAVSNEDFAMGQVVFKLAAQKMGMAADDLQAIVWFGEKDYWATHGWTGTAGAFKSSFDEAFDVYFPVGQPIRSEADGAAIIKFNQKKRLLMEDMYNLTNPSTLDSPELLKKALSNEKKHWKEYDAAADSDVVREYRAGQSGRDEIATTLERGERELAADAIAHGRYPSGSISDSLPAGVGETVTFAVGKQEKAFYSKMEGVLDNKIQGKQATPEQIKAIIDPSKGSGVKAEEIKWTGILTKVDELAAENNGKVPKAELMDWLKNEAAVQFKETVLKNDAIDYRTEFINEAEKYDMWIDFGMDGELIVYNNDNQEVDYLDLPESVRQAQNDSPEGQARYAEYQLPNGENYKETVVTMPVVTAEDKVEAKSKYAAVLRAAQDDIRQSKRIIERNEKLIVEYKEELDGGKRAQKSYSTYVEKANTRINSAQRTIDNAKTRVNNTFAELDKIEASLAQESYTSSHFPDIPNYVAHMRTNERQDSTGARGLLSEEYQSDLHQAARKQGYNTPRGVEVAAKELTAALNKNSEKEGLKPLSKPLTPSEAQEMLLRKAQFDWVAERIGVDEATRLAELARQDLDSVPDAPFRKDWSLQLFKRQLRDAVAAGLDWVGWTTGETQNERYDLSKVIDNVTYSQQQHQGETAYHISVQDKQNKTIQAKKYLTPSKLEELIGKDLAQEIVDGAGEASETSSFHSSLETKKLSGLDLKVGGSGMKGFYDNMLPNTVGKYVKQWGAKVEDGGIKVTGAPAMASGEMVMDSLGIPAENQESWWGNLSAEERDDYLELSYKKNERFKIIPIHKVKITDAMRESVKTVGQPSFAISREGDTAQQKINSLMRDPEARLEIYKKMGEMLEKTRARVYAKQIALGGATAASMQEADSEMDERDFILTSIAELQAITNALPMELRPKVGGINDIAKKKSTRGKLKVLLDRIDRADKLLDKYVSDHYVKKINNLKKQAKLKKGKTDKVGKGTLTATKHSEIDLIEDVLEMTDAQVDSEVSKNENILIHPQTEEGEATEAIMNILRLQTYGKLMKEDARPQANAAIMKEAADQLGKLVADGKAAYAVLQEEKEQRRRAMASDFIDVVSGGKGVPDSDERVRFKAKRDKQVVRGYVLEVKAKMNSFEHLIEHISRLDNSKSMESKIRVWAEKIHRSTHDESMAVANKTVELERAVARIYGIDPDKKGWHNKTVKIIAKISKQFERNISRSYVNKKQVVSLTPEHAAEVVAGVNDVILLKEGLAKVTKEDIAAIKEQMEKHPKAKTVKFTKEEHGGAKNMFLSVDNILNLTMLYGQEGYRDLMHHHGYTEEVMEQLEGELSEQERRIRSYMLGQNDKNYDYFNNIYAKVFGVNMRKVKHYSKGTFEHHGVTPVELMDSEGATAMSITPSSGMARIQHLAEPKQGAGAIPLFLETIRETEHFVAWAEVIGDIRATFLNKDAQNTIEAYHGEAVKTQLNKSIEEFTEGGNKVDSNARYKLIDKLRQDFTVMSLAWKWHIVLKQFSSLPAYASHIPAADYVKYQLEFFTSLEHIKKMATLPYTKHRFATGNTRDVMLVLAHHGERSGLEKIADFGMKGVAVGDILPVIMGGYAAYRHGYEKAKLENPKNGEAFWEKRGILAFEMLTDNAQQSGYLKDISGFAKSGSLPRVMTMYSTSLIQYQNNETTAITDVLAGRIDSKKKLAKILFINHALLPSFFYWISHYTANAARADGDEESIEDAMAGWYYSMILGSASGIYIFGKQFSSLATGYTYSMPIFAAGEAAARGIHKTYDMMFNDESITPDDFLEAINHWADAASYVRGKGLGKAFEISKNVAKSVGFDRNDAKRLAMNDVDGAVYDLAKIKKYVYESEEMPDRELDKWAYKQAEHDRWISLSDEYSNYLEENQLEDEVWKQVRERLKEKKLLPVTVERRMR